VTYWPKIANFAHPFSFSALVRVTPFKFMEKLYYYYYYYYYSPALCM